jgi:ABC-type lipoprotein release transport system permease subunit
MASRATAAAFSVSSFNLGLVALVATALVAVAALGTFVPARRASLLDPNTVLRQE